MQAVTMENDIRDNADYGYYRQNLYKPENTGGAAVPEEVTLEEAVYNGAGEDVLSDISSINNPLSNPEERTAFQERIAAQVNIETQASGFVSDVEADIPAVSDLGAAVEYQPELPGSGGSEVEVELLGSGPKDESYQPELLGSGSSEEGYQPELLGSGSSEEGYQPELLGSGSSEEGYQPEILGSGSSEKGYRPELPGGSNKETYEPRILGSNANKNDGNTETVHIKSRQAAHETVKKNPVRAKSGSTKIVRLAHADVNKIVKSHKKLRSNPSANRSSVERLEAQIQSSIKESMKNNRENSREMNNMLHKKGNSIIEKIVHNAKNSSKDDFKNNGGNINNEDYTPKHKDNDLSCQCPTCKNRRFVDRSNDVGVSFSSPQKMNSAGAAILARNHEGEHVAAEAMKAFQEGRTIVRQSVTIYMRNCPDCGARYVAGGVTRTITKMRADVAYKKAMETVRNRHKNRDL